MTDPDTVSADYTLRPSELADTLAILVEARQPAIVYGPPGCAKSQIAQQVAADTKRDYVDVRALLLDPVDLRGIPWRDGADRTRWAPPAFLPPSDDPGRWLINLEELPSAVPMVQAALYQLVLDRKCGEYQLPEGASLIACGNRESDRGDVHRMPTPLASRFVQVWRELPHPKAVIDDPENAEIPGNASALIALCGSLYRLADDINLGAIVTYATRLRREVGEFLVGSCIRRDPDLQHSEAFVRWAAARTR